ncbi:unnamed protein product [Effrenium voratum]|nr:unnamed protein product [Effrenium voratum]
MQTSSQLPPPRSWELPPARFQCLCRTSRMPKDIAGSVARTFAMGTLDNDSAVLCYEDTAVPNWPHCVGLGVTSDGLDVALPALPIKACGFRLRNYGRSMPC